MMHASTLTLPLILALSAALAPAQVRTAVAPQGGPGTAAAVTGDQHYQAFLMIEGVQGFSTHPKYKGWIEVGGWGFDVKQSTTTTSSSGGGTAGKATLSDLQVSGGLDLTFPALAQLSASGKLINRVELHVLDLNSSKTVLQIQLTKTLISQVAVQQAGTLAAGLRQNLSFNFERIYWETTAPNGAKISGSWNNGTNTP